MFKLSNTFQKPAQGSNAQRGFPAPGAGAQTVGQGQRPPGFVPQEPVRPTQGTRSWFRPTNGVAQAQRGFPSPQNKAQRIPAGTRRNPPLFPATPVYVETPYYSRGTAAFVPNVGKVLSNPIGGGIAAGFRPQASYGGAAQYFNGALWWTSQAIPTSLNLQGLTDPAALNEQLGSVLVQAVVRTTG